MSNYEYDFLVFIGRFQPFHNGHKKVIDEALGRSRRVIVLLGSSRQPKNMRNPWNDSQRAEMILNTYPGINEGIIPDRPMANSEFIIPGMQDRLICSGIMDYPYCDNDDIWIAQVQRKVQSFVAIYGTNKSKIGLIGMSKDNSSYYLKLFPKWDSINVVQKVVYNATDVRNHYFSTFPVINTNVLPDSTVTFLKKYLETTDFKYVLEEKMAVEKIRDRWKGSPYPPTFITTDAVVVQSGHILLINRKHQPGKGLLALPGGYINESERLVDGMIRELREETGIKVPAPVLRGNIVLAKVFDDPNRSTRGRIVTHAYHIALPPGELPKVKGSDDAEKAEWIPLSELTPENMFEDHYHIISNMLGLTLVE